MEKKKKEIGLIRENVQKQKNLNTTLKNMKELERNQAIKKKVEKVK